MVHEIRHRLESLFAGRTAGHDYTVAALRYARRVVDESVEAVAANLGLKSTHELD
jgi:hypothetical protein